MPRIYLRHLSVCCLSKFFYIDLFISDFYCFDILQYIALVFYLFWFCSSTEFLVLSFIRSSSVPYLLLFILFLLFFCLLYILFIFLTPMESAEGHLKPNKEAC